MTKKKSAGVYDAQVEAMLEGCRARKRAEISSLVEQDLPVVRRLVAESLSKAPETARRTISPWAVIGAAAAGVLVLGLLGYVGMLDLRGMQTPPPAAQGKPTQEPRGIPPTGMADVPPRITEVSAMDPPRRPGSGTAAPSPSAKGIKAIPMPPVPPGKGGPGVKTWTVTSDLPVGHVKITLSAPAVDGILMAHVPSGTPGCDWTATAGGTPLANQAKDPATLSFPITRTAGAIVVGVTRNRPSGTCKATAVHIVPARPSEPGERRTDPATPPPTAPPTPTPTQTRTPTPDPVNGAEESREKQPTTPAGSERTS
ncbi:hypothetical protein [Actinomadura monticuli]|uniref:Uncharacterized protein n=1 Tax=Actinomadura monticuli TaxID=3097367 RepID=A0ABV4QHU0_9ACTN